MKRTAYTEDEAIVRDEYRALFTSPEGKKVLTWMLTDMGFFDQVTTPEAVTLRNYAVRLLEQVGVNIEKNAYAMTSRIVDMAAQED